MKNLTLIITLMVLLIPYTLAAPLPTTPECELEGSVLNGKKEVIKYQDFEDETIYSLELEITEIGEMIMEGLKDQTCENSFEMGQIIKINVFKERHLKNYSELRIGQTVGFNAQGIIDEFSDKPWFVIDDDVGVTIVKDVKGTFENQMREVGNSFVYYIILIFIIIFVAIMYLILKK